jgi:hypothetical protein
MSKIHPMQARHPLLILVLLSAAACADEPAQPAAPFKGKVSTLGITASQLGSEWTGPTGLVIDDFKDLSNLSGEDKAVAEEVKKQVAAIGVVQTADFTYRKKLNPLHQVTLRVFVFDSEQSCRNWWKQKYQFDGWEKYYSLVVELPYSAADSKETSKRAVALGNVWITCGALDKTDDHLKVLDLYLTKIKAAAKQP